MLKEYLQEFHDILSGTEISDSSSASLEQDKGILAVVQLLDGVRKANRSLFLIGNGGSSGIVSHAAVDFVNMCKMKAFAITDNSLLTCMANDYGYENVFSQPLKSLFRQGDALLAISSSGKSPNIVNAAKLVKEKNGKVITLSGFNSANPLRQSGDFNFWLNSNNYGKVEIGHALLVHIITDELCKRV